MGNNFDIHTLNSLKIFSMKKLFLLLLVLSSLIITPLSYAADGEPAPTGNTNGGATEVIVTEDIPGMGCISEGGATPETRKYRCTIQPGFQSVMLVLRSLLKYFTYLVALAGVLMIIVSGIQYSLAGADKESAGKAKHRVQQVVTGLIFLFLIGFILNTVAPWVYR